MDRVICINDKPWLDAFTGEPANGPAKDEICEVVFSRQEPRLWNRTYLGLKGYYRIYQMSCFRPIDDSFGKETCERLEKQFEQTKNPITI